MEGFDPKYEFEAPQWIDLERDTSGAGSSPDDWFEGRMDTPMKQAAASGSPSENQYIEPQDHSSDMQSGEQDAMSENGDGDYMEIAFATQTPEPAPEHREEGEVAKIAPEEVVKPKRSKRILNIVTDWARNIGSPKSKSKGRAGKSVASPRATRSGLRRKARPPKSKSTTEPKTPKAPKTPKSASCPRVTIPVTPGVMKRSNSRSSVGRIMSTEERELEEIRRKREETVKRRKLSSSSFKRLSNSSRYTPKRSEKPLTIPKEPNFNPRLNRAGSVKSNGLNGRASDVLPSEPKQHGMVLRSTKQVTHQPKRTMPQPFKFQQRLNRADEAKSQQMKSKPFVPMAQNVAKFFATTPLRFHTKSNNEKSVAQNEGHEPQLTIPMSPQLATKKRADNKPQQSLLSSEEQAVAEIASRKPFRAQPVRDEVLNSAGDLGLPRVLPRETTIPEPITLKTEQRAAERPTPPAPIEAPAPKFYARAVPDYDKIRGLPERTKFPVTVPEPPATQLERSQHAAPEDPIIPYFKANPVPHSAPFQPKFENKKVTEPEPFKHIESHPNPVIKRIRMARQAEKESQHSRKFKANPMPMSDAASGIPFIRSKETTEPRPFDLRSERLHEQRQHEIKQHEEELEKELREAARFVANQPMATKPFVPEKSNAPLTELRPFQLNLSNRLSQRKAFDKASAEKQLQQARNDAEANMEKELADMAELKQFRRQIVHQAKPVPKHRMMQVKTSNKLLTQPMTPEVARRSMRTRAMRA